VETPVRPLLPTNLAVRLLQLAAGLALFAAGCWLALQAGLGVQPWDVLHVGIARWLDVQVGTANVAVGLVLLAIGIPLGQRPGVGTLLNMLIVGLVLNALLGQRWLDGVPAGPLAGQLTVLFAGVLTAGMGSALYIGAHIGIGPRDGLMVAAHRRWRVSVRLARFVLEGSALVLGVLLGGPVGPGTVVFAAAIGPVVQATFAVLRMRPYRDAPPTP
jgi:uncharacterized membrane protein YczE